MLKLLHIVTSANPASGGPIEGVKQLGAVNSRAGHSIDVACLTDPGPEVQTGFPLRLISFKKSYMGYCYCPEAVKWLREHRDEYDAVIVNGMWQYNSVVAWRGLKGSKVPYFIYPHGMLDPWFAKAYPLKHIKKYLYWWLLQERVVRGAKAILFTCEEERRLARRSFWPYRCREVVVNYGTSNPKGDPEAQKEKFYQRCPEARGKRMLLFLSRIHEKKGCDMLIRSFAALVQKESRNEPWLLVMAGPDQTGWVPSLKALAQSLGVAERISWPGMLKDDDKWGSFHACEAFVLPSHQENFGIAVVEAMACGRPVLISKQVNIWREIEEDGAGLVEADDQQGTCRLLSRWAALNAERRQRMAEAARITFMERFEIHRAASNMIKAIQGGMAVQDSTRPLPAFSARSA